MSRKYFKITTTLKLLKLEIFNLTQNLIINQLDTIKWNWLNVDGPSNLTLIEQNKHTYISEALCIVSRSDACGPANLLLLLIPRIDVVGWGIGWWIAL